MRLFTTSVRLFALALCYLALRPGAAVAQTEQLASSVVSTPVNTDNPRLAADNLRTTAATFHPGVNGDVASTRVQYAALIPAGTTQAGVSLQFQNVALDLLAAGVLPNVSIATYLNGVATGDTWNSSQLLNLTILQSGQQTDVKLSPAPAKSFNQLELRAAGAVNAYSLNFFAAFGPVPTASSVSPLPVQLVSFTATAAPTGPAVRLAWSTASELNSAYFVVERSLDGRTFAPVNQLAAAGTSTLTRNYACLDGAAPAGALYYRLRQVDEDGTSAYSPVRYVAARPASEAGLALYPVPARGQATLAGTAPGAEVQVLDALGQLVLRTWADASGTTQLLLPAGLRPGAYLVRAGAQTQRLAVAE